MKCCEMNEIIMKHFDGELNDIDSYRMKQHLKACPTCFQQYSILEEVMGYVEDEILPEPPEDFEDNVMAAIKAQYSMKNSKDSIYIRNPVFIACAVMGTMFLAISAFITILLQGISIVDIFNAIISKDYFYGTINNFTAVFQNCVKVIVLMGNSLLGAYYILLKNYYDIILSGASALVIIYTMSMRVAKHNEA